MNTENKIVPPEMATRSAFVSFSPLSITKNDTKPQPAPSPMPTTGATISVSGFPADLTYSKGGCDTPLTVNPVYIVLAVLGAYAIGRTQQYLRDAKKIMGSGRGNRD